MNKLEPYRKKIDALDDQIIELLAKRMDIVREVGELKAREGITIVQTDRVKEVCDRCAALGEQKGINPDLMRKIYTAIIDEAHVMERAASKKS